MKKLLTVFLFSGLAFGAIAQSSAPEAAYQRAVAIGYGELRKAQCIPCLEAYEKAFELFKHSCLSYLRAASCAQMCAKEGQAINLAEKAQEIDAELSFSILRDTLLYPELEPFRQSVPGKKMLAKANKTSVHLDSARLRVRE